MGNSTGHHLVRWRLLTSRCPVFATEIHPLKVHVFFQFSHVVTCTFRENLGKLLKKSWLSIQSTHRILYESIGFHRISHEMGWWIYEPRCQAQRRFATERDAKLEATTLGIFLGGKTEGCFPSADLDWNKNGRYWEIIGCSIRLEGVREWRIKTNKKTERNYSWGQKSWWVVRLDGQSRYSLIS